MPSTQPVAVETKVTDTGRNDDGTGPPDGPAGPEGDGADDPVPDVAAGAADPDVPADASGDADPEVAPRDGVATAVAVLVTAVGPDAALPEQAARPVATNATAATTGHLRTDVDLIATP